MWKRYRKFIIGAILLLALVAMVTLLIRGAMISPPGSAGEAPLAQEAVPTPTPLPTPAPEEDAPTMGAVFAVGLMIVCVMFLMMFGGIYIATFFLTLRQRFR